ncbi:hypothetical protein M0802_007219 [Mischocyttarus mexicanus]|nr:hypothetical protein M0802_007219 [Mischocyttarus mexicanus]
MGEEKSTSQKKLRKIQIPIESEMDTDEIVSSITQHFAYLHGVLQNIEKRMIDKLYERNTDCNAANMKIESQLKLHYKLINDVLSIVIEDVSSNIQEIDLQHIINQLKKISDMPCHLLTNIPIKDKKISFKTESNIIEALNKHCTLEIPSIPELSLVRTECLPENYQIEPTDENIIVPEFLRIKKLLENRITPTTVSDISNQSKTPRSVKIVNIINPSHFYVQCISDQPAYEKLSDDLLAYSQTASNPVYLMYIGTMCMVFCNPDKLNQGKIWYRGVINKIINVENEIYYDVMLIDIGYLEYNISIDRIKLIPSSLLSMPAFAIKCSLYGISPKDNHWNKTTVDRFRKLLAKSKTYTMNIICTSNIVNFVDLSYNCPIKEKLLSVRDNMIHMNCDILVTEDIPKSDQSIEFEDGQDFINVLTKEMNNYYNENNDKTKFNCLPVKGEICAFSNVKNIWFRGIIKSVHYTCFRIFSVDYGFIYKANIQHMRILPEFFRSSKAQAIKICLVNVKPISKCKKWTPEANKFIQQNLYHKIVVIIPVKQNNNGYYVHLYIDDYSFNTCLVDEGYAVFINPDLICQSSKTKYLSTKKSITKKLQLSLDEQENYEETSLMMIEPDSFKVSVQIHKVLSPNCIYVSDVLRMKAKTKFMLQLNDFYSKNYSPQNIDLSKDSVCVVYYEKEKSYYRACILKILTNEKALVSFYDMAIEEEIPIKHIQPLHSMFRKESAFIFKIKLAGLLPCGGTDVWPTVSCQKLFEILHENLHVPFHITVAASIEKNKEIPVELWMTKSTSVGPFSPDEMEILSINRMLVESGFALPIKGYNLTKEKVLAIEFKRQLLKTEIPDENEENILCSTESNQLDEISMLEMPSKNLERIQKEEALVKKIENIESKKDDEDEIKDKKDRKQNKIDEIMDLSFFLEEYKEENIGEDVDYKVEHEKDEIVNEIKDKVKMEIEDESNNEEKSELDDSEDDSISTEDNEDYDENKDNNIEYDFMLNINSKAQKLDLTDWLPALPIMKKSFMAIPTNVDYSGNIYLHCKKEGEKTLKYIESMLIEYCQNIKIKARDKIWKKGDICIAQYHANKLWYRAKVLAVLNKDTIEVQFVDYGNVEECTIGFIKKKVILQNIPIQSMKCVVKDLIPANGKWKIEDLDKIHALLVEKECKVTVLEITNTHLVVSITILEPIKCNLLYYIIHQLGINLALNSIYSDHFKLSQKIKSPIGSDLIIDKYINNDNISEIKTDHTIVKINDNLNSECFMKISDSTKNLNNSDDELETIKKEIVSSTSKELSVENYCHPYIPMLIPEDIDTFEVNLCFSKSLTTYYVQLNENLELKVLNDYYNQYNLLIKNLQIEAPKQPLMENLIPNTPCCSLFSDNIWYRCLIKEVIKTKNPNKILVHLWYIDFGNNEYRIITLEKCNLRIMKKEWLSLPTFAIKCRLWNINVDDSLETSKMVIEQMNQKYNTTPILKIKERHENYLFIELYTDKMCTELIYSSLIDDGYFQLKET